jgi:hypothetical protein
MAYPANQHYYRRLRPLGHPPDAILAGSSRSPGVGPRESPTTIVFGDADRLVAATDGFAASTAHD